MTLSVVAVTAAGCRSPSPNDVAGTGAGSPASPQATAPPSPSPSPTPPPVTGEVEVEVVDVGLTPGRVYTEGRPEAKTPPPDPALVDPFVAAVADWLDRHLTALQRGEAGLIDPASPFAATGDPAALEAVTSGLVGPGPVSSATYRIEVAARGAPEWATVAIEVTTDTVRDAAFVFEPRADGIRIVAAGPAADAP